MYQHKQITQFEDSGSRGTEYISEKDMAYRKMNSVDSAICEDVEGVSLTSNDEDSVFPAEKRHSTATNSQSLSTVPTNATSVVSVVKLESTPDGGKFIISPMNCSFTIPPGAITYPNTTISIAKRRDPTERRDLVHLLNGANLVSDVYELSPHAKTFDKQITLKIPVNKTTSKSIRNAILMYSPTIGPRNSEWIQIPADGKPRPETEIDTGVKSWCQLGKFCYVAFDHFCKVALAESHSDDSSEAIGDDYVDLSQYNSNNNNNGDEGNNPGDGYEEIDRTETQGGSVDQDQLERGTEPGKSQTSSSKAEIWGDVELSLEKVEGWMCDLVVRIRTQPEVACDTCLIEDTGKKTIKLLDRRRVCFTENSQLDVILKLHNKDFKLRAGDKAVKTLPSKTREERFLLEVNDGDSLLRNPFCVCSVKVKQKSNHPWSRLVPACLSASQPVSAALRVEKTLKQLQEKYDQSKAESNQNIYTAEPTSSKLHTPTITASLLGPISKKGISSLAVSSRPSDEQCREDRGKTATDLKSIVEESKPSKLKPGFLETKPQSKSKYDYMELTGDRETPENHVYIPLQNIRPSDKEGSTDDEADCINYNQIKVVYISHVDTITMNSPTLAHRADKSTENQYVNMSNAAANNCHSEEYLRYVQAEIPDILKGPVFDTLRDLLKESSHNLTRESFFQMCLADDEFEAVRELRKALEETKNYCSADKLTLEIRKEILRQKRHHLADILKVQEVSQRMFTKGLMHSQKMEALRQLSSSREKSIYLIQEVVLRLNLTDLDCFVDMLNELGQQDIVQLITFS